MVHKLSRRDLLRFAGIGGIATLAAACQPKIVEVEKVVTQVVKEVVKETVMVAGTPKVVEKEITKVVEKVVTPTVESKPLMTSSGKCVVWDCPNSVADMPAKEEKEKAFKEAYPDIDIDIDYFLGGSTDDFKQKAITQMAAGIYCDAMYYQDYGDLVIKGLFMPLDPWIEVDAEIDWNDYLDIAKQACMYRGKVYRIPMTVNAWQFYYNKEMLGNMGIKSPADYIKENRWTWDDGFLEMCQKATQGEGTSKTWGYPLQTGGGYWGHDDLISIIWSYGGNMYKSNPWRCALDEEPAIAAMQYAIDLEDKYKVCPEPGSELPGGMQLDWALFMYTGIWMLSSGAFRESLETFGFDRMGNVRLPYGPKTGLSHNEGGAGGSMATPTKAENPETGWVWHKWNANEYLKTMISNYHAQAPARKSMLQDPGYLGSFASFEDKAEWEYSLETTWALPQPLNGNECINTWMAEWDRVRLGEITVKEMVDIVKPKVDELIKDTPDPDQPIA